MSELADEIRRYEAHWSREWERAGCDRAPDRPDGETFYCYDSGPFTNGTLHMGHVRTYVLGDVTARRQRALGRTVLYCTEWDAFGMPIEGEAARERLTPPELVRRSIEAMGRQLRVLGVSHDRARIRATCEPGYVRWTQWLFLTLLEHGVVERREREAPYCATCKTYVSRMQVAGGRCWRCDEPVESRLAPQWFVRLSTRSDALLAGLDELTGWDDAIRRIVRGLVRGGGGRIGEEDDWLVSRQRAWGTPIPIVHCPACGPVPVPAPELPVELPHDLDWSRGAAALAAHPSFSAVDCPACGGDARRETDTLDCFFDDVWCFLAPLVDLDDAPGFDGERVRAWMPVDRFHSGVDTAAYLHLHRFLAAVLHERGELPVAEPIRAHRANGMVLHRGRKMGKHLGNVVSPSSLVRRHGADAVRLAVLWAAAPGTPLEWRAALLGRGRSLIRRSLRLYALAGAAGGTSATGATSAAARSLRRRAARDLDDVGRFVDELRPNAALETLGAAIRRIESYAVHRLETGRLPPADAASLRAVLELVAIAIVPFAPHLAEEAWHRLGNETLVVEQRWRPLAPA